MELTRQWYVIINYSLGANSIGVKGAVAISVAMKNVTNLRHLE